MWTRAEVAKRIDHAVLKPAFTTRDLETHAAMCLRLGVGCLCVRPTDVAHAVRLLDGSSCIPAAVVGFPHGISRPRVKALETRLAIEDGAREIDMVMNYGRFLSGDAAFVHRDIAMVVSEAKPFSVPVKVILETCYLKPGQIAEACLLARDAGADFVKTSTGFAEGGATPEAVAVMLKTVGSSMRVKASGGIRTWEEAVMYLDMGCARLGVGSTEAVLSGGAGTGGY